MTEKNKKKTIIIHQQFLKLCSKIRIKKKRFRKFYLIQLYRFVSNFRRVCFSFFLDFYKVKDQTAFCRISEIETKNRTFWRNS